MKKFKIVITGLIVLFLAVSFVSAVDIDEFKAPSGFDDGIGGSMDNGDFSIKLDSFDKDLNSDEFKGDSFKKVTVKDDVAEFIDDFKDSVYCKELIKIGKKEYVVTCSFNEKDSSKLSECSKYLQDFNKKNDLKPLNLTEMKLD